MRAQTTVVSVAIACAALSAGCGVNAPSVQPRTQAKASRHADSQCVPDSMPALSGTTVQIDLKMANDDDHWAYWKAGTAQMVYQALPAFVASDQWDMRVTRRFPLIGSNGGKTATDEGVPGGKAAFALACGSVPATLDQIERLAFTEDTNEPLDYGGVKLGAEYQNPILNNIGKGIVSKYNMRDHSVELSQRVFVLRAVDGKSYYAIRFTDYSRRDRTATFEWRKLQ